MNADFLPCFTFVVLVCITLFSIFIPLQLDGIVEWSWREVFIPCYIMHASLFILSYAALDFLRFEMEEYAAHIWLNLANLCALLFSVLLSLQLDGVVDLPWWGVFMPLFICLADTLLLYSAEPKPMTRDFQKPESRWEVLVEMTIACFTVFLVLLCMWLHGVEWLSWMATWQLLAPLWLLDMCYLAFLLDEIQIAAGSWEQRQRWQSSGAAIPFGAFALLVAISFKLLLVLTVDGMMPDGSLYVYAFCPFWTWAVVVFAVVPLVGCCWLCFHGCGDDD